MMKKLIIIFWILLIVIASCQKAPVANFTVDINKAYIGQTIQFSNLSTDSKTFLWDFGDNETSTAINPTHEYETGGPKTIVLTVSNDEGDDTFISKVNIYDGTASYQVSNKSTMSLKLMSYYYDGDEIQDFVLHGIIARNGLSDTVFTKRAVIRMGGEMYGETFVVIEDYPIVKNTHNILEINSNTDIYSINVNNKSANKEWNLLNEHLSN